MRLKLRIVSALLCGLALAFGAVGLGGSQAQAEDMEMEAIALGACPMGVGGFWIFTWNTCPAGDCPDGSDNTCGWVDRLVWQNGAWVKKGQTCGC